MFAPRCSDRVSLFIAARTCFGVCIRAPETIPRWARRSNPEPRRDIIEEPGQHDARRARSRDREHPGAWRGSCRSCHTGADRRDQAGDRRTCQISRRWTWTLAGSRPQCRNAARGL